MTTSVAADLILRGGNLYEPGATAPQRADLAIAGGTVIGAGDVSSTADAHTEIIDVAGRLVLPGFTDAHVTRVPHSWKTCSATWSAARTLPAISPPSAAMPTTTVMSTG